MSLGDICQLSDVTERLKGALRFSLAPENNPGIISKTVDVSLYKEGNSFGFVLRGQCKSCPWAGAGEVADSNSAYVLFCFNESMYKSDIS